jgi:hypothetical protein
VVSGFLKIAGCKVHAFIEDEISKIVSILLDVVVSFNFILYFDYFRRSFNIINKESTKLNSCRIPFSLFFLFNQENLLESLLSPVMTNLAAAFPL